MPPKAETAGIETGSKKITAFQSAAGDGSFF